jgi:16S rRNA (guanine966-N2)-methyltransferase
MRITTGKYKNKLLRAPGRIRPTQDKVRKAIFDILGDIKGLSFLELFAGSGAVGFEALSREAGSLTLVENCRECVLAIEKNREMLGLEDCSVLSLDWEKAIKLLRDNKKKFDIIFLDPPYYEGAAKKTLQTLGGCDILAPDGLIVVQHFKKDNLPETAGDLALFKQSHYGDTLLSFYRKGKCAR